MSYVDKMPTVSELVKGKTAKLMSIVKSDGLWYIIEDKDFPFMFPISFEEAKGGIFKKEMKAIELMRWIRKYHTIMVEFFDKKVTFDHYSDGEAWYDLDGFLFPVPISEIVGMAVSDQMSAIQLAPFIERHRKTVKEWGEIKKAHESGEEEQ